MAEARGLETRKPVDDLTSLDFSEYPLWEYATDEEGRPGQDETWVRPLADESAAFQYFAAADFVLADGTRVTGCAEIIEPLLEGVTLFTDGRSIQLSMEPDSRDQRRAAEALDRPMAKVFPIMFKLRALVADSGAPRTGVI